MSDLSDYLSQNDPSFRRARLPALYSDFRGQRILNPDGYVANVAAWRSALSLLAWNGQLSSTSPTPKRLVLETDDSFPAKLQSQQFGRPLALGTVVREAAANGELLPVTDFLNRQQSIYHKAGWSIGSVPWSMASWAARQLGFGATGTSSGEDRVPKGSYVIVANVERAAAAVADKIASKGSDSRFDRTFTRAHFERLFASELKGPALVGKDMDVFLRFLERDKGLVVSDGKIVRLKRPDDEHEETSITQEDTTVAELRVLVEDLTHQNRLLAKKVEELETEAKAAVAKRKNVVAMGLLRQKKTAETMLSRRTTALNQMEDLAAKIQQARDQVQFVRVLEGSSGVLKELNKEVGGVERVEGAMDALREQMSETDELGRILAGVAEDAVDEEEVDAELREMERAEQQKVEAAAQKEREEKERKEAEETRLRLEQAGVVPVDEAEKLREATTTPTTEAAERLRRMSLDERPQAELAS